MTLPLPAQFRLDGRIAFVSGAGRHLGKAMATVLAEAGAHVILNGRGLAVLKDVAGELSGRGLACECAAFDMGDIEAVREFFARQKRLDIIVNAAVSMTPAPFDQVTPEAFGETYRSAVVGAFEAIRAGLPALRRGVAEAGEASVVNIATMYAGVAPRPQLYADPAGASPAHYGAAKAGLLQLTRHLAAQLGPERIRVNALLPGPFPKDAVRNNDPAFAERLAGATMLGRLGNAGEIAGPLLFLASPASSYITGASLPVDGGWTAW